MFQADGGAWSVYRLAWHLLRFFVGVYDIVCGLVSRLLTTVKLVLRTHRTDNFRQEKQYIERHKEYFTKTPEHLAIILGPEEPDFRVLSKIIFWCFSAGIPIVSFYDHRGKLVADNHKLYEYLSRWKTASDRIHWNISTRDICGSQIIYQNGLQKELTVNFLSPRECRPKIAEVCRNMAADAGISTKTLDINTVDRHMAEIVRPDPELALYFGAVCCTYGFLPWHIRLTEFLPVDAQRTLTVDAFISNLYKYAKCEQRFGH